MIKTIMVDWSPRRKPLLGSGELIEPNTATIFAIIQARQGSKRLPNKIYKDLNGAPMLYHTISRASEVKLLNKIIVASPEPLPDLPDGVTEYVYGGDEMDVLGRYVACINAYPCDYVVRLTSDCPLLDPYLIDFIATKSIGFDYGSNVLVSTFPDGMDVEVISSDLLRHLASLDLKESEREHVTLAIRNNPFIQAKFNLLSVQSYKDYSYLKLSVDTEFDLERVRRWEKQKV